MKTLKTLSVLWTLLFFASCNPYSGENELLVAREFLSHGNYDLAIRSYRKVVERGPTPLTKEALSQIAFIQKTYLSKYSRAAENLKTLLQIEETPIEKEKIFMQLADLYFEEIKDYTKAIEFYRQLLDQRGKGTDPRNKLNALVQIAVSYERQLKLDLSEEYYKKALQHPSLTEPKRFQILNQLAHLAFSAGHCHKALILFEELTQRYLFFPQQVFIRFSRASCLEEVGRLQEAYQSYQALKKDYPYPKVIEWKIKELGKRSFIKTEKPKKRRRR